jgi:hypothetical protein
MSCLTAIANTHTHTHTHTNPRTKHTLAHNLAEGEKSGEREGNSGETMAMPSDGEIERFKRDGRMCVVRGGGWEDGPLCKREQLSPPFQFSKAPEHCGTRSRTPL